MSVVSLSDLSPLCLTFPGYQDLRRRSRSHSPFNQSRSWYIFFIFICQLYFGAVNDSKYKSKNESMRVTLTIRAQMLFWPRKLISVQIRLCFAFLKSDGWRTDKRSLKAAWWSKATEAVHAHSVVPLQKLTGKHCTHVVRKDWSWLLGRTRRRLGGRVSGFTGYRDDKQKDSVALSMLSPGANRRGAASGSQLGGILAHAHRATLSWPHPAWSLLFSRILPDPPLSPPQHLPAAFGSSANT